MGGSNLRNEAGCPPVHAITTPALPPTPMCWPQGKRPEQIPTTVGSAPTLKAK